MGSSAKSCRGRGGARVIRYKLTFAILCKLINHPRPARTGGLPLSAVPSSLTHGGNALFRIAERFRSIATGNAFGRSGACSISIAAARSSARSSTISFTRSISAFRKLAMRLIRRSRTSASCPLFNVSMYCTNLLSLSSAVFGFPMGMADSPAAPMVWVRSVGGI